jgi:uncharacterized HhH-GPD family protein
VPFVPVTGNAEADELNATNPLALLISMLLDQQIPLEWAFQGPHTLKERLGGKLDAADIAARDPDELAKVFAERPALHRYPASMAKRVHELATHLVEEYGGDAAAVWETARDGKDLYRRIKALPGFGDQKARIFIALLAKQLGVRPPGWEEAAGEYAQPGARKSVADITDDNSLLEVRAYKQEKKRAAKAAKAANS